MHEQNQEELDLRSYLRPIWRRKWIILAIVVVATAATYVISSRQANTYTATTGIYVQTADPTQGISLNAAPSAPTANDIADVAQLITAQAVTNSVARRLGVTPTFAGQAVTATPATSSDFVTITATSHSAKLAARLANAYATTFLASRRQAVRAEALRDAQAAQVTLQSTPNASASPAEQQAVLQEIEAYRQIAINPSAGAQRVNVAAVPSLPSSPKPKRDAIFGGVVGLVLAIIVAFTLELLDRRLTRVATVESVLGRPVLAVLPHVGDPAPRSQGVAPIVPAPFLEELRSLRVMLRLSGGHKDHPVIMITSALPREGKSTVTRDLALVYAESGERVLVIDSDLRRPSLDRFFGLEADRGLVHVLRGEATLAEVAQNAMTAQHASEPATNGNGAVHNGNRAWHNGNGAAHNGNGAAHRQRNFGGVGAVDLLTCGERLDNPTALLASDQMWALLEEARRSYDIVLLDTAPVLTVVDNVSQMEHVDGVLLVTRLGQLTRGSAQRFNDVVGRLSNVDVSGVIVNDLREKADDGGYGSYGRYGYGYYYANGAQNKESTTAAL